MTMDVCIPAWYLPIYALMVLLVSVMTLSAIAYMLDAILSRILHRWVRYYRWWRGR